MCQLILTISKAWQRTLLRGARCKSPLPFAETKSAVSTSFGFVSFAGLPRKLGKELYFAERGASRCFPSRKRKALCPRLLALLVSLVRQESLAKNFTSRSAARAAAFPRENEKRCVRVFYLSFKSSSTVSNQGARACKMASRSLAACSSCCPGSCSRAAPWNTRTRKSL